MQLADEVAEEVQAEHGTNLEFEGCVISQVAHLVTDALCDTWPNDLLLFAKHGKRSIVNANDVKLLVRKNESLVKFIEEELEKPSSTRRQKSSTRRCSEAISDTKKDNSSGAKAFKEKSSGGRRGRPSKTTSNANSDVNISKITNFLANDSEPVAGPSGINGSVSINEQAEDECSRSSVVDGVCLPANATYGRKVDLSDKPSGISEESPVGGVDSIDFDDAASSVVIESDSNSAQASEQAIEMELRVQGNERRFEQWSEIQEKDEGKKTCKNKLRVKRKAEGANAGARKRKISKQCAMASTCNRLETDEESMRNGGVSEILEKDKQRVEVVFNSVVNKPARDAKPAITEAINSGMKISVGKGTMGQDDLSTRAELLRCPKERALSPEPNQQLKKDAFSSGGSFKDFFATPSPISCCASKAPKDLHTAENCGGPAIAVKDSSSKHMSRPCRNISETLQSQRIENLELAVSRRTSIVSKDSADFDDSDTEFDFESIDAVQPESSAVARVGNGCTDRIDRRKQHTVKTTNPKQKSRFSDFNFDSDEDENFDEIMAISTNMENSSGNTDTKRGDRVNYVENYKGGEIGRDQIAKAVDRLLEQGKQSKAVTRAKTVEDRQEELKTRLAKEFSTFNFESDDEDEEEAASGNEREDVSFIAAVGRERCDQRHMVGISNMDERAAMKTFTAFNFESDDEERDGISISCSPKSIISNGQMVSEEAIEETNDSFDDDFDLDATVLAEDKMHLMSAMGYFIGRHPKSILLTVFLVVIPILSYFVWFPIIVETDIRRGFAHRNGASLNELERFANFYNITLDDFEIFTVIVTSKEGHLIPLKMSPEVCDDVSRLGEYICSVSVNSTKYGFINFNEFRVEKGNIDHAFKAFRMAYGLQNALAPDFDKSIVLSYPNSFIYGYTLPVIMNFFAAEVNNQFQEQGLATAIESLYAIAIFYILSAHGRMGRERLQQWEISLLEQSEQRNFSEYFDFYVYGDQIANYEAEKGPVKTISMLSVGIILMVTYMTYIMSGLPRKSQVLLTVVAISSPLLACATSFALLGWFGIAYNSFMCLTPSLVLGIGVDDAFLLLHHWRKNADIVDPAERMRRVICEIGPSMTITSLTNALAFGVGAFSPTKIMSLFCVCTAVAMSLDYVFELSVFAPCLLLTSRWEKESIKVDYRSEVPTVWWRYSKLIVSKWGRLSALIIVVLLYILAFFGIQKMETTFDASKTFQSTSPLKYTVDLADVIYAECAPISFVVSNPPNLTDPSDLANFMGMVERLESRPEAYGRERTLWWLLNYIEFCRNELGIEMSLNGTNSSISLNYLDDFAKTQILGDQNIVHYHINERGQTVLDSFILTVIYKGTHGWLVRAQLASEIREFLLDYPQYNITLFDYDSSIFDLIMTVKKELAKTVLITLCCMACVCFAFTPNILITGIATLSILSISCTLLGMLSWWNLDIDPITMINVLMAVGFGVDFSAHTCYHFHKYARTRHAILPRSDEKVAKLAHIFNAIGNPLIEAGASTVICLLPLFAVDSYIIRAFVKTVCLVGALGILHGLFILPSILSLELGCKRCDGSKACQRSALLNSDHITKENALVI
ncbi:Patched domain-containing protein 3 [Toxocara canis]|uniref:Centromere protein S n=1 Tax=Toxocara canis TaxID=6265 RepID=A0A0B2VV41_TOXCA|nr:Patched domain-containing protein 3 [Toxocara canis]